MTIIARGLARYIAVPVVSAGIIGGAALGSAGLATAAPTRPEALPAIVANGLATAATTGPDAQPAIAANGHTTAATSTAFATDRPFCHPRTRCRGPYHR